MHEAELRAMLRVDEDHWWYRGRRAIVAAVLARHGLDHGDRALDAGCGSGRMLDELSGYEHVAGVDAAPTAVARARSRGHAGVLLSRIETLPFPDGSFDLVTCFDVLEHLPDDAAALAELRRVTAPGGHLLLTVPAYPWLWSAHDVRNEHRRRYRLDDVLRLAPRSGWKPVVATHFNAALLVPAAAVRLWSDRPRSRRSAVRSDLERTPPRLATALERVLRAEATILGRGGRLPAGLSILALLEAVSRARALDMTARPAR